MTVVIGTDFFNKCKAITKATLLALALMCLPMANANADSLDSKGTDFWLAFPKNYNGGEAEFSFFLSSNLDQTITIDIPGLGYSDTVALTANVATKYVLPTNVEVLQEDTVTNQGIHLHAPQEFTAYGLSRLQYSTDAYLGLPSDVSGNAFTLLAWDTGLAGGSQYSVLGTTDNTTVTIIPTANDACASEVEITLNAGDVYRHTSCAQGDVTGTRISASAPVSVFAGHECANIPELDYGYCDHLIEQLPSDDTWGQKFIITPLATRTKGDTVRILASHDNTVVTFGGAEIATLAAGEYHEAVFSTPGTLEANQPVLVAQYSNGTTFDGITSDPFMMVIPPYEQFLDDYTFAVPTEGFRTNYANIVVKESLKSLLLLDGVALDASGFTAIAGSEFSFAQVELTPGSHTLTGAVAGVFVYGYDVDDSYGYPGGLSLSEVALVENVELLPNFEIVNSEACFKARVSDLLNAAIPDIRVDFLVELLEGSERTDATGIATFCVEAGDNPSEYKVTATVGEITTNATVVQPVVTEGPVVSPPVDEEPVAAPASGGGGHGGSSSLSILLLLALFGWLRKRSFRI